MNTTADSNNAAPTSTCPICDSHRVVIAGSKGDATRIACARCRGFFVHPTPSHRVLRAAYDDPAYFAGSLTGGYINYDKQTQAVLETFSSTLDVQFGKGRGRKLLDVGCAYGSHLAIARRRGWDVTGIEVSAHARDVAARRLGRKAHVIGSVGELPLGRYDVVILMDVIEHLAAPRSVFYDLFSKGVIDQDTTVIISTPNAGSARSLSMGTGWEYFHPPFHLSYFAPSTMRHLLEELRFEKIEISGVYPQKDVARGDDIDRQLEDSSGILAVAKGSDFAAFMQERYVPGTWSRLTAYEHLPRYLFASQYAAGQRVLDFGCGSGYGAATLARYASEVIAIDISKEALAWATKKHEQVNIQFLWADDLAKSLSGAGLRLVTCFEVIEHLSEVQQDDLLRNLGAALSEDGILVISTPNPKMTCLYGKNPFHLHELPLTEFEKLLRKHFPSVAIYPEKVRTGVTISQDVPDELLVSDPVSLTQLCGPDVCEPAAYVAVCSNQPALKIKKTVHWDSSCDYIFEKIKGVPRPVDEK